MINYDTLSRQTSLIIMQFSIKQSNQDFFSPTFNKGDHLLYNFLDIFNCCPHLCTQLQLLQTRREIIPKCTLCSCKSSIKCHSCRQSHTQTQHPTLVYVQIYLFSVCFFFLKEPAAFVLTTQAQCRDPFSKSSSSVKISVFVGC